MQALSDRPVDSLSFWQAPERVTASPNPDQATQQTIEIMCRHIANAANDPVLRDVARDAVNQFGRLALEPGERGRVAESAWQWCKTFIAFVHHELLLRRWLGERDHLQGLIAPDVLVRMEKPEGDCAIFTMCICAMLKAFGVPYEIVTVAVNPREPSVFSHVYAYAVMSDGRRIALDASHGDYPGWQVPASDVSRIQAWDESGRPVADRGSRFDGLHNYGMRGLGADPTYEEYVPQAGTSVDEFGNIIYGGQGAGYTPPIAGVPAITVPAKSNSTQWADFASTMAKAGLTLAQINAIQPGTVVSANGAILRQNPGYAVPAPNNLTANLGGGSSTLLYAGLGLGALLVVGMMLGGRK